MSAYKIEKSIEKLRVMAVCSGLGHVKRGAETFFEGLGVEFRRDPEIQLVLFRASGGSGINEICLHPLRRNGHLARYIGKLIGRSGYFVEQFSFFLQLLPYFFRYKPGLIYVSDIVIANLLRILNAKMNLKFKILYRNGGGAEPAFFSRWDFIQQLSPEHLLNAVQSGVSPEKQILLPSAEAFTREGTPSKESERTRLKLKLGLPSDRKVVLSVGALGRPVKRMEYVIQEVANLQNPRPYLILLGERTPEADAINIFGTQLLGKSGFRADSVNKNQMDDYYRASDIFTLASCEEGFGLVYIEALSHGLPCLVHDYKTSRYILGNMGNMAIFLSMGI